VSARRSTRRRLHVREQLHTEPPVVIDASIAVQWFVPEPGSADSARLLQSTAVFLAPDFMPVEATNAWWKKSRRGEMSASQVEQAIARLLAVGIELVPSAALLRRAARFALDLEQAVYDCVYLALAAQRHARLATADGRLRRSAEGLAVSVWRPSR
jgi:predicted nucleic acid-binding protein